MKAVAHLISIFGLFVSNPSFAQTGTVMDACTMTSEILSGERKYAVYLPPGYESSSRSYPVLYLLAYYKQHGALELINNLPEQEKNAVRWFIDCGDDDFLFEGNSLIHIAMRKREIPHEFRVRDGGHTWTYWRESLPNVLSFISQAFHQH